MEIFCDRVKSIQNDSTLNNQVLKAEYNVFIIGFQQSGKSTLANLLSDQKQLEFEKNGNLYNPINQHYFPISSDGTEDSAKQSEDGTTQTEDGTKQPEGGTKQPEGGGTKQPEEGGTKQPTSFIMQDFQIWDFPGYGIREDSKTEIPKNHPNDETTNNIQIQQSNDDSTKDKQQKEDKNSQNNADDIKDIENRFQQVILMNQASASHIIMVFPYSQFTQDRGQNIIQIINLIAQKDLPASIIISKVPKKMKLKNIIKKLEEQLSQKEVIYRKIYQCKQQVKGEFKYQTNLYWQKITINLNKNGLNKQKSLYSIKNTLTKQKSNFHFFQINNQKLTNMLKNYKINCK